MSQIDAFLFDLGGTLVETEFLKAQSYAKAVGELSAGGVSEHLVIEAFKEVVGRSGHEVAEMLLKRFDLYEPAHQQMQAVWASSAVEALVKIRLQHYNRMIEEPQVIQQNIYPHIIEHVYNALALGYKTGLATMFSREQTMRVLDVICMQDCFEYIATQDDVTAGKPKPEIYQRVARALGVNPGKCLVFEDSVSGVTAALAAGMNVIAVSTPLTRDLLIKTQLLPAWQVVQSPQELTGIVDKFL